MQNWSTEVGRPLEMLEDTEDFVMERFKAYTVLNQVSGSLRINVLTSVSFSPTLSVTDTVH